MISRRAIGVDDAARDAADAVHELLARAVTDRGEGTFGGGRVVRLECAVVAASRP